VSLRGDEQTRSGGAHRIISCPQKKNELIRRHLRRNFQETGRTHLWEGNLQKLQVCFGGGGHPPDQGESHESALLNCRITYKVPGSKTKGLDTMGEKRTGSKSLSEKRRTRYKEYNNAEGVMGGAGTNLEDQKHLRKSELGDSKWSGSKTESKAVYRVKKSIDLVCYSDSNY